MSKNHHFSTPEFTKLRARAKDKRDKGVAALNREYEANLKSIAALEQDLYGSQNSRHKKVSESVEQVVPRDTPFNSVDIMASLEALDPSRVWHKRAVIAHICRLRELGIVKRIKRATIHEPASYIWSDKAPEQPAAATMTLEQVIRKVLTRAMTVIEIIVAVKEAGYGTTMNRNNFRNTVKEVLRRGDFKTDGGKWVKG